MIKKQKKQNKKYRTFNLVSLTVLVWFKLRLQTPTGDLPLYTTLWLLSHLICILRE